MSAPSIPPSAPLTTSSKVAVSSLALGGYTPDSNALGVTGNVNVSGAIVSGGAITATVGNKFAFWGQVNASGFAIGTAADTILTRAGAANWQLGDHDAAAPVAQTLSVQSVVAGTTNTAGANLTVKGSAGTGTGAGGSLLFQTAAAGTTGTAQNAFTTALTIDSTKAVTFGVGPSFTAAGNLSMASGGLQNLNSINWALSRGSINAPVDGVVEFLNNSGTGFTRLQLGGTTSSFGAIGVSGTTVKAQLADGSGDAPFTAKSISVSSASFDTGYVYVQPTTGQTVVIAVTTTREIIDPAGTLLALTITFPPSPSNGQLFSYTITQSITTLTLNTSDGSTIVNTLTSAAGGATGGWIFRTANTSWYQTK